MAPPARLLKSVLYDGNAIVELPVGATALRYGDLCKWSSNLIVPAADNDDDNIFYVALEDAVATEAKCKFVPLRSVYRLEMEYTGGTPALGVAYGISDARTLDVANTTELLLVAEKVDTDRSRVNCTPYFISA